MSCGNYGKVVGLLCGYVHKGQKVEWILANCYGNYGNYGKYFACPVSAIGQSKPSYIYIRLNYANFLYYA